MANPTYLGYLNEEGGYLTEPYLGDTALWATCMQVQLVVKDRLHTVGMQVARQVVDSLHSVGMQIDRVVGEEHSVAMEVARMVVDEAHSVGMQTNLTIVDFLAPVGMQVERTINNDHSVGMEVARHVNNEPHAVGMEVDRALVNPGDGYAMEIRRDHAIAHWLCSDQGYLQEAYLTDPYLAPGMCAQMGMEVLRVVKNEPKAVGMEVMRLVRAQRAIAMEVQLRIVDATKAVGMEVDRVHVTSLAMQVRRVLYNTKLLRIMCDFPSRGVNGVNWTASSTDTGDFSPNNLNTDIVEQRWQSGTGVTSATLTCDTQIPQGTAIDTFAMLEHNLTSSAVITVEGSDDPGFSPVEQSFNPDPGRINSYYIAPLFPTIQSRYWRVIISDPTNPDGQLKIGTIVFGTATIFSGECFVDTVRRKRLHFADKVPTEGFTNVSNNRALKRSIGLEFRFIEYAGGNWNALDQIFDAVRTSLKCLWIPDPQDPPRFAVFAKLTTIPDELHRNLGEEASDTLDFLIDLDESQ